MKKTLLSLVLLLGMSGLAFAESVPLPVNSGNQPINESSYGGVRWSTSNFSTTGTNSTITVTVGHKEVAINSVFISSGPGATYVSFFSSYSWSANTPEIFRVNNGTQAVGGNSTTGTYIRFDPPYRFEASTFTSNGSTAEAPCVIWRVTNGDNAQLHSNIVVGYTLK